MRVPFNEGGYIEQSLERLLESLKVQGPPVVFSKSVLGQECGT